MYAYLACSISTDGNPDGEAPLESVCRRVWTESYRHHGSQSQHLLIRTRGSRPSSPYHGDDDPFLPFSEVFCRNDQVLPLVVTVVLEAATAPLPPMIRGTISRRRRGGQDIPGLQPPKYCSILHPIHYGMGMSEAASLVPRLSEYFEQQK